MREISVKDLKDQMGMTGPRPFLYCSVCGAESSAHKGDYFMASPSYVFTCCDEPMALVTKRVTYAEVA